MIRQRLLNSALQFLVLSAVAMSLTLTSPAELNAFDSCGYYANQCAQQCGSTVTYEGQYSYYDPQGCWNDTTQSWEGCNVSVNEWSWGNGVQEFECQDADPESSICMCTY